MGYCTLVHLYSANATIYISPNCYVIMLEGLCISHSDDQFETPSDLMEWLNTSLRNTHGGYYRFRTGPKLKALEPGSIVLFYKKNLIVGSAVVEKASRPLKPDEKDRCDEIHGTDNNCSGLENIIKFFPNSIWVWNEQELVDADEFEEITGCKLKYYVSIKPEHVLEIFNLVAKKREEMEASFKPC